MFMFLNYRNIKLSDIFSTKNVYKMNVMKPKVNYNTTFNYKQNLLIKTESLQMILRKKVEL